MRYYIDPQTEQTYAYEDDCPSNYIKEGLISITEDKNRAILEDIENKQKAQAEIDLAQQQMLEKSDRIITLFEDLTELGVDING